MRITRIETKDFKALRGHNTFDLPPGIIGIVGGNGQGKSTLTSAISWALYGPLVFDKKFKSSDIINWYSDSASVTIDFEMGSDQYSLTRTQRSAGATAHLEGPTSADGPDAVTKAVSELLGVDRVGFLASVFSRQKDLEGLASLDGQDRTRTVLRLRGLDVITKATEKLNDRFKEDKRELASLRSVVTNPRPQSEYTQQIKQLTERLDRIDIELEELRLRKGELDDEVKILDAKQAPLAAKRKAHQLYVQAKASADARYNEALNALEEARRLAAEPLKPAPKPPDTTVDPKKYARLVDKQSEDREFMRTLKATLDADVSCPTCLRPFDNAEELAAAKAKADKQWDATVKRMQKRQPEIDKMNQVLTEEAEFKQQYAKWERIDKVSWQQRQDALGARQKAMQAAEWARESLSPVEDVSSEYEALVASIRDAENRGANFRERIATLGGQETALEIQIMALEDEKAKAADVSSRLKDVESSVIHSEVAVSLMKEFKREQTSRLTPDISAKASDLLTDLTDGKYTELLLTPDWDIQYRYENGDVKGFHLLSVGERNTFALALRLALADLRAGNIGLLVLDEVLDAMDENRQNLTWATLEGMLTRYEQIIVITHVSAFKERAPHIIQL